MSANKKILKITSWQAKEEISPITIDSWRKDTREKLCLENFQPSQLITRNRNRMTIIEIEPINEYGIFGYGTNAHHRKSPMPQHQVQYRYVDQ